MNDIAGKLSLLPETPGVYMMRDEEGHIIYVGKAVNLKRRVSQYFGSPRGKSLKILRMISLISDFEYQTADTEEEALILENELIKRFKPKYNTLLKDDKTYPYIRVTLGENYPRVTLSRKTDDAKSRYFGPFTESGRVRDIIALTNRVFRLRICGALPKKPCLYYHLGQCMAPCIGNVSEKEYHRAVNHALYFIEGHYDYVERYLRYRMRRYSEGLEYEKALEMRDLLKDIGALKKSEDRLSKRIDEALSGLRSLLGISTDRIESYDISEISGTAKVGSMTVFLRGRPSKKDYRRFRIKTVKGADDYASLREVLIRRFMREEDGSFPPLPDLILIDGGAGQVHAAVKVLRDFKLDIPVSGMVKDDKHRTRGLIFNDKEIDIDPYSETFKLITSVQDETHRFAISYHRRLRSKAALKSELRSIEHIGPKREKALLAYCGGVNIIRNMSEEELLKVPGMNSLSAKSVYLYFHGSG